MLELKVVELQGLQKKEDILDWVKTPGNNKEKLVELVKNTSQWTPAKGEAETSNTGFELSKALRAGKDLQVLDIPINWAIKNLIPLESITLLPGRGGIGKTILSIDMTDAISKGILFMGLETIKRPVVYIDFENSLPVLVERIKRIGASDVLFWHPTNEIKPPRLDSKDWEWYKKLPDGAVLVFDTLRASQSRDENDSQHMAMIMQRLKELRDLGFTIILLHHTVKSNDRQYKGSTAIFDLSDHVLGLHKVKRGSCSVEEGKENDDDDDSDDYCYRLGTKDKTRYEPFHIFIEFDIDRGCFKLAPDPDVETLQEIHHLLAGRDALTMNKIYELVKAELHIKSKGKVVRLLKKGAGEFWNSESQGKGKPTHYKVTSPSVLVYTRRPVDYPAATSPDQKDQLPQKRLESPDFTDQSSSPAHVQTCRTGYETTSPDHFEKLRPVQTTSDDLKPVETEEILEVEFVEEIGNV